MPFDIQPSTPSGDCVTASSPVVIAAFPALLHQVSIWCVGAAGTAIFYDNASTNAGTVLWRIEAAANTCFSHTFDSPMIANNGITVAITGTGAIANAGFSKE